MSVRRHAFRGFCAFRQTEGFTQNHFIEGKRFLRALNSFCFGFRGGYPLRFGNCFCERIGFGGC